MLDSVIKSSLLPTALEHLEGTEGTIRFLVLYLSVWFSCSIMSRLVATPGFPIHHQPPELAEIHVHPVSDVIQPSHPLSYPSPGFSLSQNQGLFQWVSSSHQVSKYWSFSFNISPSIEYSGLISFRIDWLHLFAVQRTLKNLLQLRSSKVSTLFITFPQIGMMGGTE